MYNNVYIVTLDYGLVTKIINEGFLSTGTQLLLWKLTILYESPYWDGCIS